ncbi:phosphotransferase family protein [Kribbella sp. NPDC004536]|uniref:phosphotransferase family protein n=1 Tax=Kribbella sp. NPDC004536 TaxID=3364106 RepID=UPI0036C7034F
MEPTAEQLLRELTGQDVRVVARSELGSSADAPVTRLTLDRPYDGIGRTVIAKGRRLVDDAWGSSGLRDNEQRALEHLRDTGLAPRLLAGVPGGLTVMTDVGAPTVQELLFGDDPDAATRGLVAMAELAGTLHRTASANFTAAQEVSFLDRPLDLWPEVAQAVDELGFPAPREVELDALAVALQETTFTHGDFTPNNVVLTDRARMIDLEGAGRRHPGLDAACLRLPFPQYGHWAVLPADVSAEMERAYRAELDVDGDVLMATGCATWAIIRLARLRMIASAQQGLVRRRTQIVQTLESAAEAAGVVYPVFGAWFAELADAMRLRWEEAQLPPRTFRCFSNQ